MSSLTFGVWSEEELAILYAAPTPKDAKRALASKGYRRSIQSIRDKRRPRDTPEQYRKPCSPPTSGR